jgi:hypothetical protein
VRTHYYDDEADDVSFDNALLLGPRSFFRSLQTPPGHNGIHAYIQKLLPFCTLKVWLLLVFSVLAEHPSVLGFAREQ